MNYTAIDGDISDFIDAQAELTTVFRTDELRSYLLNEGHTAEEVVRALIEWQQDRFWQLDPAWETFSLSFSVRRQWPSFVIALTKTIGAGGGHLPTPFLATHCVTVVNLGENLPAVKCLSLALKASGR